MSYRYKVRKLYVQVNPFLSTKSLSNRVQYIMRDSPLIQDGIPFFIEPILSPDDLYGLNGKRKWYELVAIFFRNLWQLLL